MPTSYETTGAAVGRMVTKKQAQYGDSFGAAPKIMAILYPDGIRREQYQDVLTVVRVLDKLKRIATRHPSDTESPWKDIAGYAVLACDRERRHGRTRLEEEEAPCHVSISA
jgi:hypothetical protein